MGLFKVRVRVFDLQDTGKSKEIEAVVDTGATYPVVPRQVAVELGLTPVESRTFTLASGTQVPRSLAWAGVSYGAKSSPCLVVLGEEGDVPVLGAFALEGLGLEVNPLARTLNPAQQYLLKLEGPGFTTPFPAGNTSSSGTPLSV